MSQKGITINTTDAGHVDASDHALLFSAIFGMNGILTGYGGGIKNKIELLKHEKNDMSKYFIKKGNVL